jgi:hypothetical protein
VPARQRRKYLTTITAILTGNDQTTPIGLVHFDVRVFTTIATMCGAYGFIAGAPGTLQVTV